MLINKDNLSENIEQLSAVFFGIDEQLEIKKL